MKTTKISHVAHLVEICVRHNIRKVVISPGSRNAPFIIAFDAHPKIEVFVVHDERSAGFFAMGMAEADRNPVAVVCTSGSAAVNYAPALTEAYYRQIPLLVLTADRPVELIDQGDGQTIRQKNVFANYIKAQFELPNYPGAEELKISDAMVNQALRELIQEPQGPVHINIPLAEPLYELAELETQPLVEPIEINELKLTADEKKQIASEWSTAEKKLVIIGQMEPDTLTTAVLQPLLDDPSVAILVENTSNCYHFNSICHCIDRTLSKISPDELENFLPDLLVTMGGAVISKRVKALLRKHKPKSNWRIGQFLFEANTYQSLTTSFNVSPQTFLSFITQLEVEANSNFGNQWKQQDFLAEEKQIQYLAQIPFSDLKAFELILDTMPDSINLHMANSSVVRYCQLFNPVRGVRYFANRGVSGIDGSSSTAAGIAVSTPDQLNLLITGDISFFYDSNALWNQYLGNNLRIIVINNGGGGIFKIIDGPSKSPGRDLFVAPFQAEVKGICEAFNVHYMKANSEASLLNSFADFYAHRSDQRPVLLEVDTTGIENETILKNYFKAIGADFKK